MSTDEHGRPLNPAPQIELARRMGVTQAAISRLEQPRDLLLSTLNAYLQAIGGTARVIVSIGDGHEATQPRRTNVDLRRAQFPR